MGVGVGMRKNYVTSTTGQLLPVYEIYTVVKYSPRGNYGYNKDYLNNVKPGMLIFFPTRINFNQDQSWYCLTLLHMTLLPFTHNCYLIQNLS